MYYSNAKYSKMWKAKVAPCLIVALQSFAAHQLCYLRDNVNAPVHMCIGTHIISLVQKGETIYSSAPPSKQKIIMHSYSHTGAPVISSAT